MNCLCPIPQSCNQAGNQCRNIINRIIVPNPSMSYQLYLYICIDSLYTIILYI